MCALEIFVRSEAAEPLAIVVEEVAATAEVAVVEVDVAKETVAAPSED